MARESLEKLYVDELKDLWSAEQMIIKALPDMIEKASHPGLKRALQDHLQVTRGQVDRLQRIFDQLNLSPGGEKCDGMEGILKEGQKVVKEWHDSDVLDAAIISAAQRVEHYEMAGYGCVRTWASLLGLPEQSELLQQTLNEEGEADHRLTAIAEEAVNVDALKV